ncbi:Pre-mRNA-splicing factor SLT11 [Candida viswanathii]|uniref:Pre-mRNA-splicing factor SLT11 n=1 Tax=Candida viswanathii TaxID=5486 RepID=A0A367XM03_9ASCO|nr:Pre-mRNA-splicing factor SLT11 [Candida viswanathii]
MSSDTFSICSTCLGPDKHIKLIKQSNGAECRQCTRPFTVYRWGNRSSSSKLQKTIICITCAQARHCCQSCLLDITYGIPTDIRDTALKMAGLEPVWNAANNPTNREVKATMADKLEKKFKDEESKTNDILSKLAEKLNVTKKNEEEEKKSGDVPVDVGKLAKKLPFRNLLDVSKYKDMTSFFIFGFPSDIPKSMISAHASQYGKLKSIVISSESRCGFITFESKESANAFAKAVDENGMNENKATAGLLLLDSNPMRVCFGKQRPFPGVAGDMKKLSGVVAKVMKQLAEKDKGGKGASSSLKLAATKYKALQNDYEE